MSRYQEKIRRHTNISNKHNSKRQRNHQNKTWQVYWSYRLETENNNEYAKNSNVSRQCARNHWKVSRDGNLKSQVEMLEIKNCNRNEECFSLAY